MERRFLETLLLILAESGGLADGLSDAARDAGFTPCRVHGELAARTWVAEHPHVDVAVIDMDASDGSMAVARWLRSQDPFRTVLALTSLSSGRHAIELLDAGVIPVQKPVAAEPIVRFLSTYSRVRRPPSTTTGGVEGSRMAAVLRLYSRERKLSSRQSEILRLYLTGLHDKEIASKLDLAETTIYEHWRRMAAKANVRYKSGLVGDLHRFLASA
jgi:DNA-binding NarL/FixJ family response regulator